MVFQKRSMRTLVITGLVLSDLFVFVGSFIMAFILTHQTFEFSDIHWTKLFSFNRGEYPGIVFVWEAMPLPMWLEFYPYVVGMLVFVPIIRLVMMTRLGLYRLDGEFSILEDIIETFRAVTIGTILMIVVAFSMSGGVGEDRFVPGRRIFPVDWALCLGGCILIRVVLRTVQYQARKRGRNMTPVILLGRGPMSEVLRRELENDPIIGYKIVQEIPIESGDADYRQKLAQLPEIIQQTGAREVFVTSKSIPHNDLFPALMHSGYEVSFKVVPDLLGLRPKKVDITRLQNVPLLELFVDPIRGVTGTMKRTLDLVIAGSALIVLAIPMVIVAILIKLDSKGPVFFKQTRMGRDFRPFPMYKFRSMRADTDASRHAEFMKRVILEGEGEVDEKTGKKVFKEKNDPRITRIGKFIRKYSIDELPQLFNVIRGEMSIVGPRPPVPYEVALYKDYHLPRMSAKPGITGVWQVSGRNAISFDQMVAMDIAYMENWSILTDIKIILKTIPVVLFPKDTF